MAGTGPSSIRSYIFFADSTIQGGGTYAENELPFIDMDDGTPFKSHTMQIVNDAGSDIFFRISQQPSVLNITNILRGPGGKTFEEGELVEGVTSGAVGTISLVGTNLLQVVDIAGGPFAAEDIVGRKTRATATTAAPVAGADHGRAAAGESLTQDFACRTTLFLRGTPGAAFRLWAY